MNHISARLEGASHRVATILPGKRTSPVAPQSLRDHPSQAFAATLASMKLKVEGTTSQTTVARQNSVTASNPPVTTAIGFNALVPTAASTVAPSPAPVPAATSPAQSADDAYWSRQPAAVQQLRN